MGVGNCGWDLLWVWVTVGMGTGVWVTVSVGNFGFWVVVAGSGVVPKPRNKLLVRQGFLIVFMPRRLILIRLFSTRL